MNRFVALAGNDAQRSQLKWLSFLAGLSCGIYLAIAVLGRLCFYSQAIEDLQRRPIVAILILLAVAFAIYLASVRIGSQLPNGQALLIVIFSGALLMRLPLLIATPIQEVDIYRYVWDGAVGQTGISPFRFSPQQVRLATAGAGDPQLEQLADRYQADAGLKQVVDRIHYPELVTLYPPVSQAVFAAAAATTPASSSADRRILVMKAWLVGFDLATIALVIGLLWLTGRPMGLGILYAWCPLVIKEVANSGHLDAIAVFLTTLGLMFIVWAQQPRARGRLGGVLCGAAAVTLAAAVGAKLYPMVLVPLAAVLFAKRLGCLLGLIPTGTLVAGALLLVWPLLASSKPKGAVTSAPALHQNETTGAAGQPPVIPAPGPQETVSLPPPPIHPHIEEESSVAGARDAATEAGAGLVTFLRRWEMNDFLFLIVLENIRPLETLPPARRAWFSVVPPHWRTQLLTICRPVWEWIFGATGIDSQVGADEVAFLSTRALTLILSLLVTTALAIKAARTAETGVQLECAFLTIAWFWLLSPTLNPWYWTWALPLLPFAASRVWWATSGLVLVYYLRFWLIYHYGQTPVPIPGNVYDGARFFDLVVTWFEHFPWLMALAGFWLFRVIRRRSTITPESTTPA